MNVADIGIARWVIPRLSTREHCNEDDGREDNEASVAAVPPFYPDKRSTIGD